MPAEKIATCCYCGTRAALVLQGRDRHELACSSCGAPLHDLKMLRKGAGGATARAATPARPAAQSAPKPTHPKQPHPKARKAKKHKKRKGLFRHFVEEAWDVIEDIID
ncbi:hypothetical protein [Pseudooctadecabacter jejudonensis]|uniref:TFIIB zinc-binding protein n=1 Tax=Pseudooctadecabacter jejudonensis TaxID=1391910 RepID=A0A1Y5RLP1_9RHOB|nr:hypothetical protein [Pseudooctadecabacter jejudonensis]SLN20449.1 hypothetical protein PSJ8397_00761 [Pseudooctadecabacter jejudonensis]